MQTPEAVSALFTEKFRELAGGAAAADPFGRWHLQLAPPIASAWPLTDSLIYYAYARRMRPGLVDGEEVAKPWASIEAVGGELRFAGLTPQLELLGTQGVSPAPREMVETWNAVAKETAPDLLSRALTDAKAALLVRRHYCYWSAFNAVARQILPRHPAFARFIDCEGLAKQRKAEAARPTPNSILLAELNRVIPPPRTDKDWWLGVSFGFPTAWPFDDSAQIVFYGYGLRRLDASPAERSNVFAKVVREGRDGPLTLARLANKLVSHGAPPRLPPTPPAWYRTMEKVQSEPLEDVLRRAPADAALASLLREYYRSFLAGEPQIVAQIESAHRTFIEFIRAG